MDELLSAFWNRDAHEIAEENPVLPITDRGLWHALDVGLRDEMLANNEKRVSVAGKAGLDITVLIRRSEAVGESELLGHLF